MTALSAMAVRLASQPVPIGAWVMLAALGAGLAVALMPDLAHAVFGATCVSALLCRSVWRRVHTQSDPFHMALLRWGIVLRGAFVIVHLVIALWFYGGMTDLTNYMAYTKENYDDILDGTILQTANMERSGTSVGNVFTIAVLTAIALMTGPTLWAVAVVSAAVSVVGAYLYLRAFQRLYPDADGERFLACTLFLLPGVVFWSTFPGKDFMSFFFMGWATYAAAGLMTRVNVRDALGLALSAGLLMIQRAQIAVPVILALAAAFGLLELRRREIPLVFKVASAALLAYAVSSVSAEGLLIYGFKEVSVDAIAERIEFVHQGFANTPGATALAPAIEDASPISILKFLPIGVFTLLFRPFLWEAHNALAVMAGLENLALIGLIVWRRRQLAQSLASLVRTPFLAYCFLAMLGAAAAMSIGWNLGTMARHKTMIMPYLMILLAGTKPRPQGRSENEV